MIFFLLSSVSARVPLMKHKWGMIGFWRAAKRTAEASGVGRSSRLPPPPGKVENSCADPWGKSREGGLLWETMHLREAGRGLAGQGECVRRTGGGSACVRASVFVCVYGSALYVSWGKCGFDPLPPSSLLPATNKQTTTWNQLAALPRQMTDISEESMFFMNNEITTSKNKSTPTQNIYTYAVHTQKKRKKKK